MYIINVITLALCLSIVLIFRQLDKNSRSIDKVRKFSDKVKGEFELHFAKKREELQNASVDIDVKQSQAVAAVKRLEKIIEEFDAKTKTYEKHISAVTMLEQRASDYDSVIKTLYEMTERVEENLLRIKKESGVIDKIDVKLQEQRKTIDVIEKKIPFIQNEFAVKNEAHLKEVVSGLFTSIQSDISQIELSTANSLKKNAEILEDIQKSYDNAYEQAALRADNLEHAAFDKLRNKAVERVEKYHQLLDEKTTSLSEVIKQKIEETQSLIKNFKLSWQQEASDYLNSMRMDLQKTTEEYDEVTQKINDNFSNFEAETRDLARRINEELLTGDDLLQNMRKKVELETSETRTLFEQRNSELLHTIDSSITQQTQAMETRTKDIQNLAQNSLSEIRSFVEHEVDSISKTAEDTTNTIRIYVDQTTSQLSQTVEAQTTAAKEKLQEESLRISSELDKSLRDISRQQEEKSSSTFEAMDKRIKEYQDELLYRFERLEKTVTDIDDLEEHLQKAMNEVSNRVLADFSIFAKEQKKSYSEFKQEISVQADEITQKVQTLESDLNELKQRAYDNVSEKLKGFEDDFFADLAQRSNALNDSLSQWRGNFDSKLDSMALSFEDERRNLEIKYAEDLKERIAGLTERLKEQTSTLSDAITAKDRQIQDASSRFDAEIADFMRNYGSELEKSKEDANLYLRKELSSYIAGIDEQIKRHEKEVAQELDKMSSTIGSSSEQASALLESIRSDFGQWKERMNEQFSEASVIFTDKLNNFETNSKEMIGQVEHAFKSEVIEYMDKTVQARNSIEQDIQRLSNETRETLEMYEQRAAEMVNEFKNSYDQMLEETQRRIKENNSEADQKLREEKRLVQEIKERNETSQEKMVLKMQSDADNLNKTMDDIDRRIKQFVAQTQLFDRTDKLKDELEGKITELKTEIAEVQTFGKTIAVLEQQFMKIKKSEEEINQKVLKFGQEKKHIEAMEMTFNRLMTLSDTMDQKMDELRTTNDDLQQMQIEVRKFQETLSDISSRYDRFEKKNEVLDQTITGVDKTFEILKDIEKRLASCSKETIELPEQIGDLKKGVDKLMIINPKIVEALEKVSSLESILSQTETRMDELQNAREWLARTESRLQEISKEAESNIKLFGEIQKNANPKPRREEGAPPPKIRESVVKLAHANWRPEDIASRLGLAVSEVELILETYNK